jgi:hypothetical protein
MLGDKFVLQKAFPATVEALNNLVSFFPHREIPTRYTERRNPSDPRGAGRSARANRTADRIFGYGLVGFGLTFACGNSQSL